MHKVVAAMNGPTPDISVREVPVACTATASLLASRNCSSAARGPVHPSWREGFRTALG